MDIFHTEQFKYFTFANLSFAPADVEMLERYCVSTLRKLVRITDPHVKMDADYGVFTAGLAAKHIFVEDCNGDVFVGKSWPGNSVWLDFLNTKAREFWGS